MFARWRDMKSNAAIRSSFTPAQRGQIVQRIIVDGWTYGQAAAAFGVREGLVAAWVAEYRRYGMASLRDHPGKTTAAELVRVRLVRPVRSLCRGLSSGLRSLLACESPVAPSPLRRRHDDRTGGS
jgi:transposase-like protein